MGKDIGFCGITEDICRKEGKCEKCSLKHIHENIEHYAMLHEAGRLIELPCAVGDTVWCIDSFNLDGTLRKQPIIREIEFNHHHLEFVGKTVFLTKEEAEAKLAE